MKKLVLSKLGKSTLLVLAAFALCSCSKYKPTIYTSDVIGFSSSSATVGGIITDDGGMTVSSRGICYNEGDETPTIKGSTIVSGGYGTGMFEVTMTGLNKLTQYSYRAFATNSAGTAYGEQKSFTISETGSIVIIGEGTVQNYYTPFGNYWKYSTSASIYTRDEIGQSGWINKISFNCGTSSSLDCSSIKVYMVNTSKSVFSSSTDWETSANLVYSGYGTIGTSTGWYDINLNPSFYYSNSTGNLMVIVVKQSSSWNGTQTWLHTTTSGNTSLYRSSDSNSNYSSITSTIEGALTTQRPNIKLYFN